MKPKLPPHMWHPARLAAVLPYIAPASLQKIDVLLFDDLADVKRWRQYKANGSFTFEASHKGYRWAYLKAAGIWGAVRRDVDDHHRRVFVLYRDDTSPTRQPDVLFLTAPDLYAAQQGHKRLPLARDEMGEWSARLLEAAGVQPIDLDLPWPDNMRPLLRYEDEGNEQAQVPLFTNRGIHFVPADGLLWAAMGLNSTRKRDLRKEFAEVVYAVYQFFALQWTLVAVHTPATWSDAQIAYFLGKRGIKTSRYTVRRAVEALVRFFMLDVVAMREDPLARANANYFYGYLPGEGLSPDIGAVEQIEQRAAISNARMHGLVLSSEQQPWRTLYWRQRAYQAAPHPMYYRCAWELWRARNATDDELLALKLRQDDELVAHQQEQRDARIERVQQVIAGSRTLAAQ